MAVIEYDEYKQKLQALEPTLGELEKALGIPKAREELAELQKETEQEGFWNDLERSQQVSRQVKRLENKIKKHDKLVSEWEDTLTLCEMAQEEDDPSQLEEVVSGYETLEKEISERRLAALLSGEYDANNAILTFHAGAGGTEAQDWTEMLYRMYTRWAERHGYTYQLMDYEAGDEAGIKSATILIEGENAYGYLKSENGVHRLVRVSPFDANARRQTSFAALEVMPELDDDSEIEIRPEDIEMQACRSSGAGGQHINKTSSAVRLTHLPTGIVVFCQTERSQFQNRDNAMKMLRAKLAELKLQQHAEKISDLKGVQMKIEWGSQIRSYVFMPYTLAKDTRTGYEMGNIQAVMDGDIDGFINDENPETLEANLRKWIDNIPWSRNRLETIRTCVPRALQTSFYFNIAKYHANWYQVGKWVPVQRRLHIMDETGCSLTKGVETVCKSLSADFEPDVRPLTLSAANEQYLRAFCAQAQSLGVQTLFLRTPHRTQTTDPGVFDDGAAVVGEYGYDLLDLHDAFDTIGLDRCADFIDSDHLNTAGMEIFTAWLGQYLTAHYDLTGTYSAELTAMWDRCAAFVTQTLPLCKELAAANTEQNLNEFSPQFSAWR